MTMVPRSIRPSNNRTRREFLKTGLITLSAGIATGTTGCLSSLPPLGQRQTYGRVDVPPADEPTYHPWLPSPTTFDTDSSHYTVTYSRPSQIEGNEPEAFVDRRAISKTNTDYFGIGYENYNSYLRCAFGTVVEAEFDVSTVADTLTQSGYEPDGSYRRYDVFSRTDVPRRAAVREGTIVWSSRQIHDHPAIETLIDTEAGDRQRYADVDPSFKRISDAIGASRMVVVSPNFGGLTERADLAAIGFRFADGAIYQVINLLYPEGNVPTSEQFEREVRDVEEWTDEAEVFDSEIDDRLASIETRAPRQGGGERPPFTDPPQVTWGAAHDAEAQTVLIRHEAGESVDADLLWADINPETTHSGSVIPGTQTREATPIELESIGAIKPLWDGDQEHVTPGDSATVALDSAAVSQSGQPIGLGDVGRVDVLLAAHRSDTIPPVRRLFAYDLA